MKTILVTGVTGFLGRHVVEELLRHDCHIIAAVRPSQQDTYIPMDSVTVIPNSAIFDGHLPKVDVGIHCAFSRSNNPLDLEDGVTYTQHLIAGLEQSTIGALLHISSQGVYKRLPMGQLSKEESPIEPIDLYSQTKWRCEQMFLHSRLPHVCNIRLSSLNMKQRFTYKFVEAVKNGRAITLNSPHAYASILDVRDAASALTQMAFSEPEQWDTTYNLGTGKQESLLQWAQVVQRIGIELGYPARIEMSDNGNTNSAGMSIDKLQALIPWEPKYTLEDMVREMYHWK